MKKMGKLNDKSINVSIVLQFGPHTTSFQLLLIIYILEIYDYRISHIVYLLAVFFRIEYQYAIILKLYILIVLIHLL